MSQKTDPKSHTRHLGLLGLTTLFTLVCAMATAKNSSPPTGTTASKVNYLVCDIADDAQILDPNLVNAWGMSFSATSPFWVSANAKGLAEVYSVTNDALGAPHVTQLGLEVAIPGNGTITGQACNNTTAFNGDLFIFASEDGIISGWRGDLGIAAETLTSRSGADYTGITLVPATATSTNGPVLLAANFSEGTVDVYDGSMNLVGQFSDPNAPAGYAPFNVQAAGGTIYVTFAKQDATKHGVVTGPGNGLIDVFNPATRTFSRFASGSNAGGKLSGIDTPWGVALAPASFGAHANQLLIANHGSGTIMAFNGSRSASLLGSSKSPYVINGIFGLSFGNGAGAGVPGTLYFTAGPNYQSHGVFGTINP
jgi:uncharacterized protein (TIGR03118 family)